MEVIKSIFYFVVAGLFEIGGGYLVWVLKNGLKCSVWSSILL